MRILSIGLICAVSTAAGAQAAPKRLTLVPDLRLEPKQVGNPRDALIAIGPKGQLVTTMRWSGSGIAAFDSTGKPIDWSLSTGRGNESEIGSATAIGWFGASDTMWVADVRYDQLALVDGKGKVFKSLEYPSWIHPSWAERRKYPVFGRMDPLSVFADQTMLIIPSSPKSLIDTPGYDRTTRRIMRVTWDGAIRSTLAQLPGDQRSLRIRGKGCDHTMNIPFAAAPYWSLSPDGTRLTIVEPGIQAADSGTVRITMLSERGDTIYSRRYPQPTERVTKKEVDDYLAGIRSCGEFTAEQLRDSAMKRMAPFKSFVTGILTGRDHSTWLMTRFLSDTARERGATIVDARGDVVGSVLLPLNENPLAVGHDFYWSVEPSKNRMPSAFVRFKTQATSAPPSRSAPAAASSKPSRPGT